MKKPIYKRGWFWLIIILLIIVIISASANGGNDDPAGNTNTEQNNNASNNDGNNSNTQNSSSNNATLGEQNALRAAKNYLKTMPFSYNGFEGYSEKEAKYGAQANGY